MKNLKTFLCGLIAPLCLLACMLFGGTTQIFAQDATKTYDYVVLMANNGLDVVGKYDDESTYSVAQGISLENVSAVIDADRVAQANFQPASIHFQNVNVGNNYLYLSNGDITITGSLTGLGYSTYGLVYVDGANVVFEDFTLINNGLSYLVRNVGDGNLQFIGGQYTANSTVITSRGAGSVEILGGTFTSASSSVLDVMPTSSVGITVKEAIGEAITLTAKGNAPVVVAKNADVRILGGTLQSTNGQNVFALENSPLVLANQPQLITTGTHIKTNTQITAKYFSDYYSGAKLLVDYTGEIDSWKTVLIKQLHQELFEITNAGYLLKQNGDEFIICKYSTLSYQDQRGFITNLPLDETKYIKAENTNAQFIDEDDVLLNTMKKYRFLGWSKNPNATTAEITQTNSTITFQEQDITLYAVWQAWEFVITYEDIDGAQNDNPISYTTEDNFTLNAPTKEFFVFKGWKVNGSSYPQENYQIREGMYGDLTLKAVWEYQEYQIAYHNITPSDVQSLNLPTTYTIKSSPLELTLENVLCKGYAFFGLYLDENLTVQLPQTIFLEYDLWQTNTPEFLQYNTIGQTINIFVDARPYSNGTGNGTENNPFVVETQNQFLAMFIGEKPDINSPVFVELANDIVVDKSLEGAFTGFEKFVIDGDNHKLVLAQTAFGKFGTQIAFLQTMQDCTIKNLDIDFGTQTISDTASLSFAFAGDVKDVVFDNVAISSSVNLELINPQTASTIKFGALAINAENAEFLNISTFADFDVKSLATNADVNVYGGGIVGFSAENCTFINCENNGDISLEIDNQQEAFVYVSAMANLTSESKVWNCFNKGDIVANTPTAKGILCGVMAFGKNNAVYNFVNLGAIVSGGAENLQAFPFAYAGVGVIEQKNIFNTADFVATNQQATLQKLSNGVATLSNQTNTSLNVWFMKDDCLTFAKGIVVHYVGNGLMTDQTHHFNNPSDAGKKIILFDMQKYLLEGWFLADGTPVDWNAVTSQQVTVYAKFIAFEDLIQQQQMLVVVAEICIFLIFLFILYLFDKKKPVRYFFKGEWIDTKKFGRTKTVTLPPEFDGKICFLDKEGEKPFIKKKMPCHKISLSVFEDEKQNRLEEFWNQYFEIKKSKIDEKKSKKIKKKEEKIKKQQEIEKQKEKERKKRARSNKKQTTIAKKSSKKKVLKNSSDSKITITKQEIKNKKNK